MPNVKRYARDERIRQREENVQVIYDYVVAYIQQQGHSPSLDEIARGCYTSRSNVVRYLDLLEARGYLMRVHNTPRSISLSKETPRD
ncbi:MAG: LexA family protein [Phototrophicaceae bacterium]